MKRSPLPSFDQLTVRGRRPALAPGVRIYAVGDIHGRLDLLDELFALIDADLALRPIGKPIFVFLGDYIDRGPHSRKTIDRLVERRETNECVFLKGNHEQIAINSLKDPALFQKWMRLGGVETLVSYGITKFDWTDGKKIVELQAAFHRALPQTHFRFFRDQPTSFTCGDFFFAHAGVKPRIELPRQSESDLLWIRDEFLSCREDFGKTIVHGHTPTLEIEVRPNRINIDTGAFVTGRLTCLVLEETTLSFFDTLQT